MYIIVLELLINQYIFSGDTLKLVGGSTMHITTTNILKKIMVNTLAAFSWAGIKGKLIFKD